MFLIGSALPGRMSASRRHHRLADLQPDGGDDVALLAVEVRDQRDVRRAVRSYSICATFAGDAGLVALEIDDAVMALVTAAAAPHRDAAVVVAAGNSLLRLEQRLLGVAPGVNSSRVRYV
jgi:hypothetical protein